MLDITQKLMEKHPNFKNGSIEALGLNTANPKPLYVATAPTVAEMLEASLKIVKRDPDGFFAVVEEEGTDNFANDNNAVGTIEAIRRGDAAIGVAQKYVDTQDPNTLVITAADSDAGGLQVFQYAPYTRPTGNTPTTPAILDSETQVPFVNVNPTTTNTTRAFLDGANEGQDGNDKFFVQTGGGNSFTGGAGADQFWIATAETPKSANTVTDFTIGEDVLGIAGIGASFGSLTLTQKESNTLISFNNNELAILTGIQSSTLSASNFVFV